MDDTSATPRVSLALPVYNGGRFIADALNSIVAQTYRNFELIITDNASDDGTERICRDFAAKDARIKYFRNEKNLGAGPNHNKGFHLSSGEYFKWCACDDYISPTFLARCVAALDGAPDVALAYGTTESVDEDGRIIPLIGSMGPDVSRGAPGARMYKVLAYKGTCYEIFGLFRRSVLAQTTLQRMYYGSDHSLLAEVALLGRFTFVHEAIFYNREHRDRSINMTDTTARVLWQDTSAKNKYSMEHLSQLNHLIEIAWRHRRKFPAAKTLGYLFLFETSPVQLMRLALDLVCMAFPFSRPSLRDFGWRCLRHLGIQG